MSTSEKRKVLVEQGGVSEEVADRLLGLTRKRLKRLKAKQDEPLTHVWHVAGASWSRVTAARAKQLNAIGEQAFECPKGVHPEAQLRTLKQRALR